MRAIIPRMHKNANIYLFRTIGHAIPRSGITNLLAHIPPMNVMQILTGFIEDNRVEFLAELKQ